MSDHMSNREPEGGTDTSFPRVSTGNREMDDILGGGFPANSINIIMGQPGAGKTIFAEQLLFHNADGERPLLYLTTLSEPLPKLVSYVQRLRCCDTTKIGTEILYDDLGAMLTAEGPDGLLPRIKDIIRTVSPRIVVIDSFKAIHDLTTSSQQTRYLISGLAGVLSAYETTCFLLGEYTQEHIDTFPEFAVADAIVQMERNMLGVRDERFVRVLKLRGSGYREGQHAFRITDDGITVYPRLITPRFEEYAITSERTSSGVEGLDAIIGGGLWRGSTTLLAGPTGSGKTTLALQFALEGLRRGEPALVVNFQENPVQLGRLLTSLGGGTMETLAARGLHHLYASPVELQIDSIIVEIFERILVDGIQRVVVDAVGDLASAANDPQRLHDYLYALVQHFTVRNVTSVLTFESLSGITGQNSHEQRFSYMSDNIIFLGMGTPERSARTLRIVKTRNSGHDPDAHTLELDQRGGRVL